MSTPLPAIAHRFGTPATYDPVWSGPTLHPWEIRPEVAELQEILVAHGFKLKIDGDFGYRTEAAVKTLQRRYGLRIDGIVGQRTWAALKSTLEPGSRLLRQGATGSDVWELQGLLRVNGLTVQRDGQFCDRTRQAVMAFQQSCKLRATGEVDAVTWRLLRGKPLPEAPSPSKRWRFHPQRWW